MVARAGYAMGPYTHMGEIKGTGSSVILKLDSAWLAPGHNSIVADCKGNQWIIYHAIDRKIAAKKNEESRRLILIDRIVYKNGWPVVFKMKN